MVGVSYSFKSIAITMKLEWHEREGQWWGCPFGSAFAFSIV